MKSFTKCAAFLFAVSILFGLSACGGQKEVDPAVKKQHEEIIRNNLTIDYLSNYEELPAGENRVGISVVGGEVRNEEKCITIAFSNSHVYQSLSDCTQLISRCRLFDAQHPETEIKTKFFTLSNGTSDKASFGGALSYGQGTECEYVLLKFDGVSASENAKWETPPIFWIIELEKNGTATVLTDTPLADLS